MSFSKPYQIFITLMLCISIPIVSALHSNMNSSIGHKSTTFDKNKQPQIISTIKNVGMNSEVENYPDEPDRTYLPSISVLTFTEETYTTPRRTDPRLQLECIEGTARDDTSRYPSRVDCFNRGIDQAESVPRVRWKCITPLHRGVQITKWDIHCEGWSSDVDLFIVDGSCWLEYQLDYHTTTPSGSAPTTQQVEQNILWSLQALGILLIIIACILIPLKITRDIRSERNSSIERIPLLHPEISMPSIRVTPPLSRASSRHTSRNSSPAIRPISIEGNRPSFSHI